MTHTLPVLRDAAGRVLAGSPPINPTGRPKLIQEVQQFARQHTPAAIERLAELMRSQDEKVALAAIDQLMDRAWGKPMQSTQTDIRKVDFGALYLAATKAANGYADPADAAAMIEASTNGSNDDGAADSPAEPISEGDTAAPSSVEW